MSLKELPRSEFPTGAFDDNTANAAQDYLNSQNTPENNQVKPNAESTKRPLVQRFQNILRHILNRIMFEMDMNMQSRKTEILAQPGIFPHPFVGDNEVYKQMGRRALSGPDTTMK